MELKHIEGHMPEYWEGRNNILIRFWTYVKVGLDQVNNFKYVAAAIFGVYYTLKLANPMWLVGMTLVALPALCIVGRWWLYRGSKTSEFITTMKGTVIGYNSYNLNIEQLKLLKEISEKLDQHD